jgi:hypothetical protein
MLAPAINSQNAREMQQRSCEAKRRNKIAKQLAEAKTPVDARNVARLTRLERQMERLEEQMILENDPKASAFLSSAYDKIFRVWQVLTGTANPGSRKTRSGPGSRSVPAASDAWQVTTDVTTQSGETHKHQ